jgi:hypothetical protein
LALGACKKAAVETYRIPKETTVEAAAPAAQPGGMPAAPAAPAATGTGSNMANTAVATASGAELTWQAPPHWATKAGSAMRKGSYSIKGDGGEAELAITAFPGDVGGELANVNRWRGQLQLPPITAAELPGAVSRLTVNGLAVTIVECTGGSATAPQRLLGAMVPAGGATWFFKFTGPPALIEREKPAFLAFIQTLKTP